MALEAMSAGVAVVTTNTGAEFLKDGENCLLYEPGESQRGGDLCDKLVNDAALFQKIVAGGYQTACESADSTSHRDKLIKVIEEVLKHD